MIAVIDRRLSVPPFVPPYQYVVLIGVDPWGSYSWRGAGLQPIGFSPDLGAWLLRLPASGRPAVSQRRRAPLFAWPGR